MIQQQPIYILSENSDNTLATHILMLQSLGRQVKQCSVSHLKTVQSGIVLIDCRYQELDAYGIPGILSSVGDSFARVLLYADRDVLNETVAIQRGIRGVFYLDVVPEELLKGTRSILAGEFWFNRKVVAQVLTDLLQHFYPSGVVSDPNQEPITLTKREKTILQLIAQGAKNREIAGQLNISMHTVKTHIYSTFRKTQSRNRVELLNWAKRNALSLTPELN